MSGLDRRSFLAGVSALALAPLAPAFVPPAPAAALNQHALTEAMRAGLAINVTIVRNTLRLMKDVDDWIAAHEEHARWRAQLGLMIFSSPPRIEPADDDGLSRRWMRVRLPPAEQQ